jgi:DNA primase
MLTLLVDILSSFLGEPRKHNEDTGQVAFDCPACAVDKNMPQGDGKGNLEINYEQGLFRCWACQDINDMRGPVIKLLKKYATPKNIRDYKLIRPDDFKSQVKKDSEEVVLPEGYKKFKDCSPYSYKYSQALAYLRERGITDEIIEEFNIGYTAIGKFYNRIIIPSYNAAGELNYFIARWFDKQYTKLKYINPEAEKQLIIFNENKINWDATIYLVEGATDHIVTPNSIPLLGKYISDYLLDKLYENAKAYIVIVLDDDAYEDALRLYKQLNFGKLRDRIRIVRPAAGFDPSKIYEKFGPQGIVSLLRSARRIPEIELFSS